LTLQLKKDSDLVDLSILCGNDYTGHLVYHLNRKLGFTGKLILSQVSAWLKSNDFDSHPIVKEELVCI
jgi:hypothetical protein